MENTEEVVMECVHEKTVDSSLKELNDMLMEQYALHKNILQNIKSLKTLYTKEKKNSKVKVKSTGNNNRGFKDCNITTELCTFLELPVGTKISRPAVTKRISEYIKANQLQDPSNGSIFKADKKLKKVLGEPLHLVKKKNPELGVGYSYQNLQTYLTKHFLPTPKEV